jgi:DNA-binding transcriptional regulator YiaG
VHVPDEVNVRAIRKRHALTGVEFASRFGFSPGAVKEQWSDGDNQPQGHGLGRDLRCRCFRLAPRP